MKKLAENIRFMVVFLGIIWGVFLLQLVTVWEVGVIPRTLEGLPGIGLSPFFHGGWYHIISNSIPLVILGTLAGLRQGKFNLASSTIFLIVGSGTLLWIFGRSSEHIGASGLIFGYFGFIVGSWYYKKSNFINMVIAGVVIFLYWYIIPSIFFDALFSSGISWDGHLAGLIAGIMVAKMEQRMEGA